MSQIKNRIFIYKCFVKAPIWRKISPCWQVLKYDLLIIRQWLTFLDGHPVAPPTWLVPPLAHLRCSASHHHRVCRSRFYTFCRAWSISRHHFCYCSNHSVTPSNVTITRPAVRSYIHSLNCPHNWNKTEIKLKLNGNKTKTKQFQNCFFNQDSRETF